MRLYCWNDPVKVHYGTSFLVVAAETEPAARQLAKDAVLLKYGLVEAEKLGRDAVERLGKPDYVMDCPVGFVYWMQE